MAKIEETLQALRDVEGVYGSFVISRAGALVASDLPAIFDAQLFDEVGPRITRLCETFASGGEELDGCVLRYPEHKLYLRSMAWGLIGVLSAVAVNKPALRMVVNLVIRRIDPEVVPSLRPPAPPILLTATPAPGARLPTPPPPPMRPVSYPPETPLGPTPDGRDSSPPTSSARHVRMYRGRPVTDD
jgi:predicted regulator of Ras-like GTPase activity (Roadblock/LC7/MglB family)